MFKKIYKWLDNFWYHYKWVTLITLFFVTVLTIVTVQFFTKTTPDVSVLYGGPAMLTANQARDIEISFNSILKEDFNGDGKKTTELIYFTVMTDEQLAAAIKEANENDSILLYGDSATGSNRTNFTMQLLSGENILCLVDPEQYKIAMQNGAFAPLSELFEADRIPDYAYGDGALVFAETPFAKFFTATSVLPEDTLLCVRRISENSVFKGKDRAEKQYAQQLSIYYKIVNFSLPTSPESGESSEAE